MVDEIVIIGLGLDWWRPQEGVVFDDRSGASGGGDGDGDDHSGGSGHGVDVECASGGMLWGGDDHPV